MEVTAALCNLEDLVLACGLKLGKLFPCVWTWGLLTPVGQGDHESTRLVSTPDWNRVWGPLRSHHCPWVPTVLVTLACGSPEGEVPGQSSRVEAIFCILSSRTFTVEANLNSNSNSENSPGSLRKQWKVVNIGSVPINISGVLLAVLRNFHNLALEDLST